LLGPLQILHRVRSGRYEIAHAMLLMDRERFGCLGRDVGRASADLEQLFPAARSVLEAASLPPGERQRTKTVDLDGVERALWSAAHRDRVGVRLARASIESRARKQAAERQRLTRIASGARSTLRQIQQPGSQRGEGQQIQSIVLEDCAKGPCVARAHEVKVPAWDVDAGHIAGPAVAHQMPLERQQRAVIPLPELASRVQDVHVRQLQAEPRKPVKQIARLEERGIERLAIEADERTRTGAIAGDGLEHRTLVREPRHHELPRDEPSFVEPAAADEKRVRARAAAQPGRLEVKEHERRPSGRTPCKKRRFVGRAVNPIRQLTDLVTAVTY
jgi:hypothetical protein